MMNSVNHFLRRSTRNRSASRGTDQTASVVTPQSTSQPSLRTTSFEYDSVFPVLTQPSPVVPRRRKRTQSRPAPIPLALDIVPCGVCQINCEGENEVGGNVIGCEGGCGKWFHTQCIQMSHDVFMGFHSGQPQHSWSCTNCTVTLPNIPTASPLSTSTALNLSWGKYPLSTFEKELHACYKEVMSWRKNMFLLPSGRAGKEFIQEMKRLVDLFVNKRPFCSVSLNALMVMIPLLLQKPSRSSKSSDHAKYLAKRLVLWKDGELTDILREGRKIQERLKNTRPKQDPDKARKVFVKLMFEGKVAAALRWLDTQCTRGSLVPDEEVINSLREKHPPPRPSKESDLLKGPLNKVEPVIFEQIDGHAIYKAALSTKGSGGPTHVDSDAWKRFLCSKSFGKASADLCDSVAGLAKILSTHHIPSQHLEFYTAGRLVALDKEPGKTPLQVRPIGIGEVLRRIVGKSVMILLKADITAAAGPLQACAGHRGGVEAAVHAMKDIFDDPNTEAVLLVDASNAFNSMNRQTALHNMQIICPEMSTYLINTYRSPPSLYVANSNGVKILSEEGCTQGDNAGMAFYSCNTLPLITLLHISTFCKQAWFADDSAAAGKLKDLRKWWDVLTLLYTGFFN